MGAPILGGQRISVFIWHSINCVKKNLIRLQFKPEFPIKQSFLSVHNCIRHLPEPAEKVSQN